MHENPCAAFFANHADDKERVKALREQPDHLQWEALSASHLSPHPVTDEETLVRLMFVPTHIDRVTGKPTPIALDDASGKGLSVDRINFSSREESIARGLAMADQRNREREHKNGPYELHGLNEFSTADARSIKYENARAFAIYDTAIEANRAHADVCQLVSGKAAGRSARSKLLDIMRPITIGAAA